MGTVIVQLMHPGGEPGQCSKKTVGSIIPWNTNGHCRKFMVHNGEYVSSRTQKQPIKDSLIFWGEWEPPSIIKSIYGIKSVPQCLLEPVFSGGMPKGALNTDPMIFGKRFYFTNCRQNNNKKNNPTLLQQLTSGSLILFGSHSDGAFLLDTVFVVKEGHKIKKIGDAEKIIKQHGNESLYCANLGPLFSGRCGSSFFSQYTLYEGVTYDERSEYGGMFSFVPARVGNSSPFNRIPFANSGILLGCVSPKLKQNFRRTEFSNIKCVSNIFDLVVKEVVGQNCVLGIRFEDIKCP
jgi:hypothetical protein